MRSRLLDKDKVIKALYAVQSQIYIADLYTGTDDPVSQSIRHMIHNEAAKMVQEASANFAMNLAVEHEQCEPDKFPCALCHEEDNEKAA